MSKKYKLVEQREDGLWRIQALRSGPGWNLGDFGGWVEGESNLSQAENDEAWVFGEARVSGEAQVSGKAQVFGEAQVSGKAQVSGEAVVDGEAPWFLIGPNHHGYFLTIFWTLQGARIAGGCFLGTLKEARQHTEAKHPGNKGVLALAAVAVRQIEQAMKKIPLKRTKKVTA